MYVYTYVIILCINIIVVLCVLSDERCGVVVSNIIIIIISVSPDTTAGVCVCVEILYEDEPYNSIARAACGRKNRAGWRFRFPREK